MPIKVGSESSKFRKQLSAGGQTYAYYDLATAGDFAMLPKSLKVVLENQLRNLDGETVKDEDVAAFADWASNGGKNPREIAYRPARVLMQDFTGVPAVVDLAAMRDAMRDLGGDPNKINPLSPVDLVIDHSVMVDEFGNPRAFQLNVEREYERNEERYVFLKWGQGAFENFRVVPPGTGICHQVNLEFLARTVWSDADQDGETVAYPDTLVGTDSHTTMVNGMAVLGWGVGGIEAEAAMLGQPISMLIPEVVGFKLNGKLREGVTATDLVLTVTQHAPPEGRGRKFRRVLSATGWRICRWRTARPSATWRLNTARPAASFRSTTRRCVICASRGGRRRPSRWSRPTPKPTACGATPATRRSSPIRSSSTWARSSPRSRGRSGRRTGSRSPTRRRLSGSWSLSKWARVGARRWRAPIIS